jgi:tetratricopeptide (TPR) repeat protein
MDPQGLATSIAINLFSNFVSDLLKRGEGSRSSPIKGAITSTVEKFPDIEGLGLTLEQWLHSPAVRNALEEYAKGLTGFDPVRIDALSRTLVQNTQFYLPDGAEATAREIVSRFFSEIREQYLTIPELGISHLANRLEEGISISVAGFESLKSEVGELAGDVLERQIDEARDHLQRHEDDIARQICEKLRQGTWDRLNARQKFRVLSNLATINIRQENMNEAARLFIEAKGFQPDDPLALANEALSYFLLRDNDRAFELAARVRASFPTSARALMVWLDAAPATLAMEDLAAEVPAYLYEDAEVIMALARRAFTARDMLKAEGLARRATAIKEDWSYPWALLGESIFRSALPDSAEDYMQAASLCDASRVAAAAEACTKAIELAQKEKQPGIEAGALLIRAEARRLLGDLDAEEDIVTAHSLRPNDQTVLRDYAYMKLRRGQRRDAVETLRPVAKCDGRADLRMMLAAALSGTGERRDREEATQIFSSIAANTQNVAAEARTQAAMGAIDNLVKDQKSDQARTFLSQLPPDCLSPTAVAALRAGVELSSGDRGTASQLATEAVASITANTTNDDIRLTAKLLEELGRHRDALPLWQRLASPGRLGYDTCRLIDCAVRLHEDGLFLNVCEQLRLNGVHDPQLIEAEAAIRGPYDIETTISVLQEHLRRSPEDRRARLQLSEIGIRVGRDELVSSDPALLPAPEDTAPENWKLMVLIMRAGGHLWEAIRFAYRLLRLNFGKIEAHIRTIDEMFHCVDSEGRIFRPRAGPRRVRGGIVHLVWPGIRARGRPGFPTGATMT